MDLSAGGGIGQRLRDPRPSPLSFLYRRFRAPAQGTDDRAGQNGRGSQHGASQSMGSISDIQQKFPSDAANSSAAGRPEEAGPPPASPRPRKLLRYARTSTGATGTEKGAGPPAIRRALCPWDRSGPTAVRLRPTRRTIID